MTAQPRTIGPRTTGITILAALSAIVGVLNLYGGLSSLSFAGLMGLEWVVTYGGLVVVISLLSLVTGILQLRFAYGAWTLRPWAWTIGVWSAVLGIVLALVPIVSRSPMIQGALILIAISGAILYYLNTPAVKSAFGRA
jgi:hypothetical protein